MQEIKQKQDKHYMKEVEKLIAVEFFWNFLYTSPPKKKLRHQK
jgi:hypothetical protein